MTIENRKLTPKHYPSEHLICDQCGNVISIAPIDTSWSGFKGESRETFEKAERYHRDQNKGHECNGCRNKRKSLYDDFVDPQGFYRNRAEWD